MMTSDDSASGADHTAALSQAFPVSGIDTERLSWVTSEINAALLLSLSSLRQAATGSADIRAGSLLQARAQLHQAHGALQMLELDGVTLLTASVENLLERVGEQHLLLEPALLDAVGQAFQALREYLDELQTGAPPQPARLFPYYRSLLEILGAERIHAADLFFPDLRIQPQLMPGKHTGRTADYAALRQRFEKALLRFLKSPAPHAALAMSVVLDEVEQLQEKPDCRSFWWVMHGFADAVASGQVVHDQISKQLLGRINLELRRLSTGAFKVNDSMLKDALFYIAHASTPSALQQKIRDAYHLDGKVPTDFETKQYGQTDLGALNIAHQQIVQVKNLWSRIAQGDQDAVALFEQNMELLAEACRKLNSPPLLHLLEELSYIAHHAVHDQRDESLPLEIATGLLVLESGLADIRHLPENFAVRAEAMIERLRLLDRGAPAIAFPVAGIEDSFRQAQAQAIAALVTEMQSDLREVENLLDAFFRQKLTPGALAQVTPLLHQVEGALAILEQDAAVGMLQHTQRVVGEFAGSDSAPDARTCETLAQNIGALGLFMEALQRNSADAKNHFAFDVETSSFHVLEQYRPPDDLPELPAQAVEEITLAEADLPELIVTERPGLEHADFGPSLSGESSLSESSDTEAPIAQLSMSQVVQLEAGPLPAADAHGNEPFAGAGAMSEDDAELRLIFLEEAREVLDNIDVVLNSLPRQSDGVEHLTVLRRCFHTLKGSARMIALDEFGEAAHRIEHLLACRLSAGVQTDEALYPLLWRAHAEFSGWIADLERSNWSARSAEGFWRVVEGLEELHDEPVLVEVSFTPGIPAADEVEDDPVPGLQLTEAVEDAPAEPGTKQIGELEISQLLYAIFRAEAEELLDLLTRDLVDWRRQPDRYVNIPAVHAIHSLAGSSATVGLPPVHEVAFAIESILQHQVRKPVKFTNDEFYLLGQGMECIRFMLGEVAAGQMPASEPTTVQLLRRVLQDIGARADAWLDTSAPESAEAWLDTSAPESAEAGPAELFSSVDTGSGLQSAETDGAPLSDGALFDGALFDGDPAALQDAPDADLLAIFIEEAHDIMPLFGQTLRDWRRHPDDDTLAQALLRMAHTLKGSARMAGAMRFGEHMHQMETHIEASLQAAPVAKSVFDELLLQHDRALQLYEELLLLAGADEAGEDSDAAEAGETTAALNPAANSGGAQTAVALVRVRADILDRLVNQAGEVSISRSKLETELTSLHLLLADMNDNVLRLRQQLRELEMQAESQISSQVSTQVEREFDALEFDRYTRLQELTRMMAESVDDVGTVQQSLCSSLASASLGLAAQGRLTRDLQQDLMRVRMVQFGSLSDRLYRVARQTAKELGKRVNLDIRGSSLEVDRSVLDRMAGPFEHLLRNAIVHGIETPEQRRAAGKSEQGELQIEIRQDGNEVVLQFADDGAGLNLPAIRQRAIAGGLLEQTSAPTDAELIELIFNSGFTTAGSLTQAAGRGIGMDAVRSEVTRLGGSVAVTSDAGRGMRVMIRLPLTLAITQVVLVRIAGRSYALPSQLVEQVLQLKSDAFAAACENAAVPWQSEQISLHYLSHLLGDRLGTPLSQQYAPVIILRNGLHRVAVHVDEIQGSREVVVKNVGPQLARVAGISGATVLGSGQVVLILNPLQLMQRHHQQASAAEGARGAPVPVARPAIVMVVDDSLTVRRVTQRLLLREGYQVVLAKDGVDALERLQTVTPDVMLVDIEMPRMDGFDLTRNVRDDARTRDIPIFMITSRTAAKHRNFALDLGVNRYFGKPYQEADLLRAIERVLAGKGLATVA